MTTQLEDRIRTTFNELAGTTKIDPDARFGYRSAQVIEIQPGRRRWIMSAAAAAAGIALVGGLITLARQEPAPASTAEQPLPEPQPAITIAAPLYDGVPAMFPAAESSSVFPTPEAAVEAYLSDRTAQDVLPSDLTGASPDDPTATGPRLPITFSLAGADATIVAPGDQSMTAAAVGFSLQTTNDSGDGLALTRQIAPGGEPAQWVVTSAGVASFGIDEVTFESGRLTGSFTSEIGGRTEVMVFDTATGELLTMAALPDDTGMSLVDSPVPNTDLVGPAALGVFEFDGLAVDAVTVRFWNTNAQPGGIPVAVFAETAVLRGATVRDQGRQAVQKFVNEVTPPIFDDGPITMFADLGTTGSALIFNDIVNRETDDGNIVGKGVEITARRQDDASPYCVDLVLADRTGSACFTFDQIARQTTGFNMDSDDGSLVLVGSIVTDTATSVTAPDGREIIPVGNIWYDLIPSSTSEAGAYTITAADGHTTIQQLG